MKGRKPKSLALKMLAGNPGGRPLTQTSTPFTAGSLEKPRHLDAYASKEWKRLVTTLAPVLSPAVAGMVLVACDAYAEMRHADAVLKKEGRTYKTVSESGSILIRQRPEVRMKENARRAYHQALAELGASPVASTRVYPAPKDGGPSTELKRLLG